MSFPSAQLDSDPAVASATTSPACPNCGAHAPLAYCPGCGQVQDVRPPSVRAWVTQSLDDVFDVNGRLPRTLSSLVRSPGLLTSEWLAGRRARYLAPLRLYVLCSLAMFATGIALRFIGEQFGVGYRPQGAVADGAYAEVARQSATHALFVLVPLSAVWLSVFFRRANRVYVEHLVFTLHVHAFGFLAAVAMYLMVFAPAPVRPWLQLFFQLSVLVYLLLALRRVYGRPMLQTAVKGVVLFVVHGAAVAALMFALIDLRYDSPPAKQAQVAPDQPRR